MKNFGGKVVAAFVLATIAIGSASYAAGVANTQQTGYLLCFDAKTKQVTYPGKLVCPKGKKPLSMGARGLTGAPGPAGAAGPAGASGLAGVAGSSGSSGVAGQNLFVYDSNGANLGVLVGASYASMSTTFNVLKNGFPVAYSPQNGQVGTDWEGHYGNSSCTGPISFGGTASEMSFFGTGNPLPVRGLAGGALNRVDFLAPVQPTEILPYPTTPIYELRGGTCFALAIPAPVAGVSYYKFESIGFALDAVGPLRIGN